MTLDELISIVVSFGPAAVPRMRQKTVEQGRRLASALDPECCQVAHGISRGIVGDDGSPRSSGKLACAGNVFDYEASPS
jgi:hypothetical protein